MNIIGLILQIIGVIVVGFSVTRVNTSSTTSIDNMLTDEKTGKYITRFTIPKPKMTWFGISIIVLGLIFQIIAEIFRSS